MSCWSSASLPTYFNGIVCNLWPGRSWCTFALFGISQCRLQLWWVPAAFSGSPQEIIRLPRCHGGGGIISMKFAIYLMEIGKREHSQIVHSICISINRSNKVIKQKYTFGLPAFMTMSWFNVTLFLCLWSKPLHSIFTELTLARLFHSFICIFKKQILLNSLNIKENICKKVPHKYNLVQI